MTKGIPTLALALVTLIQNPLLEQSKGSAPSQEPATAVPFVGCESDGQMGPLGAPSGSAKAVHATTEEAKRLAYYKADEGPGVLAPRGWHCFGTYGSGGATLYVSAKPINGEDLLSANWGGFEGPAVQVTYSNGDTSGRFEVARIIARVFPAYKTFADRVLDEGIDPAESFAFGPHRKDKLTYKSKEVVEYETPAHTEGLGTNSRLKKGSLPIGGVAILTGETPDLVFLAVRLPVDQSDLIPAIIRHLEMGVKRSH